MATAQPPLTSPITFSLGALASVKKTSLNSASPLIILIGRTSTPGWSIGTSRKVMPRCFGCVGVGAGEDEDPVGQVAGRGPDLLTVDDPLVAVELGLAAEVAEIGTGIRLGVALAPEVFAGDDPGQEVLLLLLGAPLDDGVADHLDAEDVVGRAGRDTGLGELLGHDHALELGEARRRRTRSATRQRGAGCREGSRAIPC